uniref:Uncharacterized protein n=1 Tax=Acrobeloides nanus TaxID=290746 RepID=A0A914CB22_9BILA
MSHIGIRATFEAIASGEYTEGFMLGVLVGALMVATFLYFWRRRRAHCARVVIAQPDAVVRCQEDGLVGNGPAIDEVVMDGIWAIFLALFLWAVNFYRGPANMLPF